MRLVFVIALVGLAIVSADPAARPKLNLLDCRRFVFAPACRGATIKRSQLLPRTIDEAISFHNFDHGSERGEHFDLKEPATDWNIRPVHSLQKML